MGKVKELVIASGKGGTGKTTFSAYLVTRLSIEGYNVVAVDADVEAPDLVIALGGGKIVDLEEVYESDVAYIQYERCTLCMECIDKCPYSAIEVVNSRPVIIQEICEGCGTCSILCPEKAIKIKKIKTGEILYYKTKYSDLITGRLEIGRKHSGLLVEMLKGRARSEISCNETEECFIVVDAAAGIGCPVISSIAGADYLVIILEPTYQSLYSAIRMAEIGKTFRIPIGFILNKWDLNPGFEEEILGKISSYGTLLGRIPFLKEIAEYYSRGVPIIESDKRIKEEFDKIYNTFIGFISR